MPTYMSFWSRLTLRSQVTMVILVAVLAFESASVGLDYLQIRNTHLAEIRNRGGAFVRESLPVIVASPAADRADVAREFNSSERTIRVGETVGIPEEDSTHLHPRIAEDLQDELVQEGFDVVGVQVADRRITMSDAQNGVFGDFLKSGQRLALQAGMKWPSEPATVSIISVRLGDSPSWYNFYILTAPISMLPLLVAASLDTVIALVLTFAMIAVISRIMRPLYGLTEGAEMLGRGEQVGALKPGGSRDVRETVFAFNRMSERISQANEYQSSLIQSLGHDLRGPLDRVRRLARTTSPAQTRDDLLDRINAVEDIVGSVTSFTRATRRDGALARVDLASLLDALVDEQQDLGHPASVDIKVAVTTRGRHNALTRSFRNLIENAIKYGGTARVTLKRTDRYAVVTIDDDGPGIAPGQMESAFHPFERLAAQGKGSGLGLAIVKAIIVDHGGEIELTNRRTSGLRATVRLPLDPVEVSRVEIHSPGPMPSR